MPDEHQYREDGQFHHYAWIDDLKLLAPPTDDELPRRRFPPVLGEGRVGLRGEMTKLPEAASAPSHRR